jgi:hypothetical protein
VVVFTTDVLGDLRKTKNRPTPIIINARRAINTAERLLFLNLFIMVCLF